MVNIVENLCKTLRETLRKKMEKLCVKTSNLNNSFKNHTFSHTFRALSADFFTAKLPLFQAIVFHFSTVPITTTTNIINNSNYRKD